MIRLLILLAALGAAIWGVTWFADNPGEVTLAFRGVDYTVSLGLGLAIAVAFAIALMIVWSVIRFVFKIPSLMSLAAKARRREKGYVALSKGMIAVGSGDQKAAARHAADAAKLIGHEPLTKLLSAQAAQLSGDRAGAANAFNAMLDHPATHALGLRGLHVEARRAGDATAALQLAERAHAHSAPSWAGQALLDEHAKRGDWAKALAALETQARARSIDKPEANRLRAVLKTGLALDSADRDPKGALSLAEEARKLAPGLVPANALAGRLAAQLGDGPRAAKILEAAYERFPHPDLASAYLRLRHGDSTQDRLARAKRLARLAPGDPESALFLAQAALDARDTDAARAALAPLLGDDKRPTVRACVLMAKIADSQGDSGGVREWLARAAHAPRDPAWVAEGNITDRWSPASPSGALDAYQWRTPDENLRPPLEFPPAPEPVAIAAPTPPAIEPPPSPPQIERPRPRPASDEQTRALNFGLPDDPGAQAHDALAPPAGRYFAEG